MTGYVNRLGDEFFDDPSVGSVGAIVGCTFPAAAATAREAMPRAPIVVVGYGAQAARLRAAPPVSPRVATARS